MNSCIFALNKKSNQHKSTYSFVLLTGEEGTALLPCCLFLLPLSPRSYRPLYSLFKSPRPASLALFFAPAFPAFLVSGTLLHCSNKAPTPARRAPSSLTKKRDWLIVFAHFIQKHYLCTRNPKTKAESHHAHAMCE